MVPALVLALAVLSVQSAPRRPQPAPTVQGEVLGQDGKPVAGAQVRIVRSDSWSLPPGMTARADDTEIEVARSETGPEGRFRCVVPEGQALAACAAHPTLGMSDAITGFAPGDTLSLRLLPTRQIKGKVLRTRDGNTAPVADHLVWFPLLPRNLHRETPRDSWRRLLLRTRTAADGSYRLEVPDQGDEAAAWTRVDGQILRGTDLTAEEPVRVGCLLVDKQSGQPVPGARLLPAFGDGLVPAVSGAAGRIETLSAGTGLAQVVPVGHRRAMLADLRPLAEGELARVELEPGAALSARFVRADGRPVADARVLLTSAIMEGNNGWGGCDWPAQTDADGRLRVGCLQKGMDTVGLVEVDGTWVLFHCTTPTTHQDLGEVVVTGATRIEGRVVGPDGAPVAGAEVRLLPPLAKGDHLNPAPVRVVTANRLGQFAAAGLVAGAWRVAARSMSYGLATATFDSKTPGPLLLTLPAGAQISGRVLDPDGQPAPRALLQAWAGRAEDEGLAARFGVRTFFAETDAQGRFTLRGLPETHALQLHAQLLGGKVSASGELRNVGTGSTDLEIVLKRQAP